MVIIAVRTRERISQSVLELCLKELKLAYKGGFLLYGWLQTIKTGIASHQLARDLEITQKTAWHMLQKIRYQMYLANESQLESKVEIDETYLGGKNGNRHWNKKVPHSQGRSHKDKTTVVGMIEREGLFIARATKDTKSKTLSALIKAFVSRGSIIYTDENGAYNQNRESL